MASYLAMSLARLSHASLLPHCCCCFTHAHGRFSWTWTTHIHTCCCTYTGGWVKVHNVTRVLPSLSCLRHVFECVRMVCQRRLLKANIAKTTTTSNFESSQIKMYTYTQVHAHQICHCYIFGYSSADQINRNSWLNHYVFYGGRRYISLLLLQWYFGT